MLDQYHCARSVADALRFGARAGTDEETKRRRDRMQPCAANRPLMYATIHPSQRRHPPQPYERPTTSPAEGSGEPSGCPRGEREGQRPADRRETRHRGGATLCEHATAPVSAMAGVRGWPRGAARPAPAGGASPATPHGARHPRDPRMLGQYQFERSVAHAFRRSARAGTGIWPLIVYRRLVAS
jgi:hypothetical protein